MVWRRYEAEGSSCLPTTSHEWLMTGGDRTHNKVDWAIISAVGWVTTGQPSLEQTTATSPWEHQR